MVFVEFHVQVVFSRVAVAHRSSVRAVSLIAIAFALAAGGCAESRSKYADAAHVRALPPQVAQAEVEMEADGLPAQVPPLRRAKPEPDEPSEPYSPNYGNPGAQKRAEAFVRPSYR